MKNLESKKTISDITLNEVYLGRVLNNTRVALNNYVLGELVKPTKLKSGSEIAVKVIKISLPSKVELEEVNMNMNKIKEKKTHDFFVKSEVLNKLKPKFERAASLIRKAIDESRMIIIKHHADCDGYCAAIAVEKAIMPLVMKNNRRGVWNYLKRTPSKTPFYDYSDALKDLSVSLENIEHNKPPLVLILDTGSTKEDIMSLKRVSQYGVQTIIVDHHKPTMNGDKAIVEEYSEVFINPHMVGGDSNLCAGMLGLELAKQINKVNGITHLAALAGVADRSEGEVFEKYLELAKKKGYTKDFLQDLSASIDYEIFYLGFMNSDIIRSVVLSPINKQKEFVELMIERINEKRKQLIKSGEKYVMIKDLPKIKIFSFEVNEILTPRRYPPAGKAAGILFDHFGNKSDKPSIMFGIGRDFITIRSAIEEFDLNVMNKELVSKFPYAQINGGGHAMAGTIKFIEGAREEIIDAVKVYLVEKYGA